jgi:hypothetical protein
METNYLYTCPHCSRECSVAETLTGQNLLCPHCSQEFFATLPDAGTSIVLPEKLPFLKSGRRRILEERLQELVADGELSDHDEQTLRKTAILLGLEESDLNELGKNAFLKEMSVIQRRIEQSWQLTDQDLEEIETLKIKYGVKKFRMEGTANIFRQIFLVEEKGEMPSPIASDLMLDEDEAAYYCVGSTWHQHRVHNRGYAGSSFSVPTGIRGLSFRFGHYSPMRSEEITPLATGTLWVTSHRLFFQGDTRNTKIEYKKIIDAHIYSDSLRIEKATGKPDYFSMDAAQARYITAFIGVFKG